VKPAQEISANERHLSRQGIDFRAPGRPPLMLTATSNGWHCNSGVRPRPSADTVYPLHAHLITPRDCGGKPRGGWGG